MRFHVEFDAVVVRWRGESAWYFISLPEDLADEIDDRFGATAGGFGAVPVEVCIGASTWRTSLFPSKQLATYVLPVKQQIRRAEGIDDGTAVSVELTVVDRR